MTTGARLIVEHPGVLTTLQDEGRWGWQHLGVPVGGPMDLASYRRANRLVGNAPGAAALEVTLVGPTLEILGPVTLALAGAAFDAHLEGQPLAHERPVYVAQRARLAIGSRRWGARAYLAVRGGFDTPVVLGSRSTSIGVLGLGSVRRGDILQVAVSAEPVAGAADAPPAERTPHSDEPLRIIAAHADVDEAIATLCSTSYEIGTQSNRMGYRLNGPHVRVPADVGFSQGTVMGMLQVPPDGQPILLMADRQTTGGYPVLGVVASVDLPRAGQLVPGDRCTFTPCTRQAAMAALLDRKREGRDG